MKPTKNLLALAVLVLFAAPSAVHGAAICGSGEAILPFVPAAGWPNGWQGFVRLDNALSSAQVVRIDAIDDAGFYYRQTVAIGANESLNFNSQDLEYGNANKGLVGTGAAPIGHWRLCFLDGYGLRPQPQAYIRTRDGFVTDMTLSVPGRDIDCEVLCPEWRVPMFNPGRNVNQVSYLRLVNNSDFNKWVQIIGVRGDGTANRDSEGLPRDVVLEIPAAMAVEVTSAQLETGVGLPQLLCESDRYCDAFGYLGSPIGKWSLWIHESNRGPSEELLVVNLLATPTGHVTNLSAGGIEDARDRR